MATARAIKKMSGFKPKSKASRRASVIPRLAPSSAQTSGPAIKLTNEKAKKDSRFKKVMEKLQAAASKMRRHPPASQKAAEAQKASIPPVNERMSGAMANQVDAMNEAPAGKPKSESFLSMLRAEIRKVMPKKTKDAKDFMKGNDRENLQSAMTGNVNKQKDEASKGIQSASEEKPDESKVAGKEVEAIPRQPSPQPDRVDAAEAMPAPQPRENVAFTQEKQDGDAALKQNNLTTSQLDKANDSRFSAVVTSKGAVEKNAQASPGLYGGAEKGILGQAAAGAAADEKTMMGGMRGGTAKAIAAVAKRQLTAKEKDEAERKKVVDHLENIYAKTKAAVEAKLAGMEEEVTSLFDKGTDTAIERMKAYVENRFDKRYSGAGGALLWAKDKLLPLPDSVKEWFNEAHDQFASDLDKLVVAVANLVEKRLKEAKDMIAAGQKEIRAYVNGLPANLQDVGKAAEKEMAGRFDELRQGVDDKKNDLARKLAQKYKDASEKGAKALQDLKDKHKSLYEKLRDAIAEVVKILKEFKERVLSLLKKARDAIDIIVADPIGFLKNLLAAIKKGVNRFVDNIWTHLKQGFLAWLFGSLADAGIEIPGDFSLPSILHLVLQVLGLTYDRIRQKAVKLIGERNVGLIEKAWEFISAILKGGPAKIWENIKEYLGNLKETVISAIQEWVVSTIIKQAVIKLVSMFNPVGAIIQAIVMIYNTVMFLIENISRIMQFVEAVVESVSNIAHGAIDAAANWIEKALAKMIPIIIAFLARLLGLSGISDKIKEIIKKIQDKVDKAIDKVIEKVVGGIGKLFGKGKAAVGKIVGKMAGWLKKRKEFSADGENHSLIFKGQAAGAELRVKSNERSMSDFLNDRETANNTAKKKDKKISDTIVQIRDIQKEINKLIQQRKPDPKKPDDPCLEDKTIEKLFDDIGVKLPILFQGTDWGTQENPVLLVNYPKKAASLYRPVYLGPRVSGALKQTTLESKISATPGKPASGWNAYAKEYSPNKVDEWISLGGKIERINLNQQENWPWKPPEADSPTFGIASEFRIQIGNTFKYEPGEGTPGGRLLNKSLSYFGFRTGTEGTDGDHVLETQLIGVKRANTIPNMWPLIKNQNRHGLKLKDTIVGNAGDPALKIDTLDKAWKKKKKELWVMIKNTKDIT